MLNFSLCHPRREYSRAKAWGQEGSREAGMECWWADGGHTRGEEIQVGSSSQGEPGRDSGEGRMWIQFFSG